MECKEGIVRHGLKMTVENVKIGRCRA